SLPGEGLRRRGRKHAPAFPRRPADPRGEAAPLRLARRARPRRGDRELQAPRLALQPPALLGRALPRAAPARWHHEALARVGAAAERSEERRVGKECSARWSPTP